MNATRQVFFSSLLRKKNLLNLLLLLIFLTLAGGGLWLLATGEFIRIHAEPLVTAGLTGLVILLAVLMAIRLAWPPINQLKQSLNEMELQNRHNQDAILRLLDEMGDLADGDLTVSATVTEDITGAIADS
ncbi:MAG TPA: methyl-accepting chemotaxis protein, partial [Methylophaga sp.]|nr:methyl-accepting chemotaxis protein [Methylophaga sp.]